MTRRTMTTMMAGAAMAAAAEPLRVTMLVYPGMTALDLVGPQQLLAGVPGAQMELVWKTKEVFSTDSGLRMAATHTLGEVKPAPGILFVPGGSEPTIRLMNDEAVIGFLRRLAPGAKYVTSVCSGSLILGAAGLLRGYNATSHWSVRDVLPVLGAKVVAARVVEDRNRITAGGVTSGIDFAITLAARLAGNEAGQMMELAYEYDPQPPFGSGTPEKAPAGVAAHMKGMYAPLNVAARKAAEQAVKRWV